MHVNITLIKLSSIREVTPPFLVRQKASVTEVPNLLRLRNSKKTRKNLTIFIPLSVAGVLFHDYIADG